jgi:gas vesicle protein
MGEGTEELSTKEAEIERTRMALSRDLDELGDKVSPQRVVERRTQAVKGRLGSVRERVMGAAPSLPGSGSGGTGPSVTDRVGDSVGGAKDALAGTAQSTVGTVQSRTTGNPLAAGLMAFGAGMVISALLPATEKEARLAQQAADAAKEHGQPLLDEAKSVGQEVGQNLKETAQQAAQEVRSTAQESVEHVKEEGQASAQTVKDQAPGA